MDLAALAGQVTDPSVHERAEREAQRLLEALKRDLQVTLQDAGTLRKQMSIRIPEKVIQEHLKHNFDELRQDAIVPGFRKGRAPRQLLQKRFGPEVRNSLKTSILGQACMAAIERENLEALGDPLFQVASDGGVKLVSFDEATTKLDLPDSGDMAFTCELEIKPTFELPELKGIEVKQPEIQIRDEDVNEHIERQRKIRGRYEPAGDAPAGDADDQLICDVRLTCDGQEIKTEENLQLGVRAARLDGIALKTLDEALRGARAGEQRSAEGEFPPDYERPDLRGKTARFEFTIHEIKRLAPATMESLWAQYGAESDEQLRQFVRDDMEAELDRLIARAKKEQVLDYLLKHTALDLPPGLSARQTDRAVVRKIIDLQQSGVPDTEIDAKIDELRVSAGEEATRNLKLEFIMEKVAERLEVRVTDEEVNSEIARIARLYNRRFDRVRDDLSSRGLLQQLAEQIRQEKCVELLLGDAKVVAAEAR